MKSAINLKWQWRKISQATDQAHAVWRFYGAARVRAMTISRVRAYIVFAYIVRAYVVYVRGKPYQTLKPSL